MNTESMYLPCLYRVRILSQSESAAAALALKTAVSGSRRKSLPLPGVTAIVAAPKVCMVTGSDQS